MASDDSVTIWIGMLKAGDQEGARRLWERYYAGLVELARKRLGGLPRGAVDEEDIALSAFHSFYQAVGRQRYPQLNNRDDLWQLLIMHTTRKAVDQRRYQQRQKRTAATPDASRPEVPPLLEEVIGTGPDPQFATLAAEAFGLLLDRLGDEQLQLIALRKLEGYANEEIAAQLACSMRSVERKLALIRATWKADSAE